jgi:hypothetical protein
MALNGGMLRLYFSESIKMGEYQIVWGKAVAEIAGRNHPLLRTYLTARFEVEVRSDFYKRKIHGRSLNLTRGVI